MGRYLRITASLLLVLQGLHVAFLQNQTDSPDADQNDTGLTDEDQYNDIPDSSMSNTPTTSGGYDDFHMLGETTVTTMLPGNDTEENIESAVTTTTAYTTILLNTSQTTNVAVESHNSTTAIPNITIHPFLQTSNGYLSNDTDLSETTDNSVINSTEDINNTTTAEPEFVPKANLTTTLSSWTTTMAPSTNETSNSMDIGTASGSNSERGFASDVKENKRSEAWGIILGTAVAVAFVGLAVYVILKRKGQRDFTHRKLVEEFPSDPVLRLDNSDPLDLRYDGSAYYNPGLQMDNIQMTNFPQGSGRK